MLIAEAVHNLPWLLGDHCTVDRFFSEYWGKKPLVRLVQPCASYRRLCAGRVSAPTWLLPRVDDGELYKQRQRQRRKSEETETEREAKSVRERERSKEREGKAERQREVSEERESLSGSIHRC